MTKRARCAQLFFFEDDIELELNHQRYKSESHLADSCDSDIIHYSELKTDLDIELRGTQKHNRSPHGYPPWTDHKARKIKDPWGPR
jgi:hypothetical protein